MNEHLKYNNPKLLSSPEISFVTKTKPPLGSDSVKIAKISSLGNNRALNPSISGNEPFHRAQKSSSHLNVKFSQQSIESVSNNVKQLPVIGASMAFTNTRRLSITSSRISNLSSTRELLPVNDTPSRRASLPMFTATTGLSYKKDFGQLLSTASSFNVSVNAPRIDKMVEFPLNSPGDNLRYHKTSSTSAQCSYTLTPPSTCGRSITKDKCTVQILERNVSAHHRLLYNGSECSEYNPTSNGASTRSSSDCRQHKFDTSSYQQRAEALDGLLEFSAQLL